MKIFYFIFGTIFAQSPEPYPCHVETVELEFATQPLWKSMDGGGK